MSITLTTPAIIQSVLGGNSPVNIDKLVLNDIRFDTVGLTLTAQLLLTSTVNSEIQNITGSLTIAGNRLVITAPELDFYRRVTLTAGQQNAVALIITDAQDALEAGLVTLGVIAGTQATGN